MSITQFALRINTLKNIDTATTSRNDSEFIVHCDGIAYKVKMDKIQSTGLLFNDLDKFIKTK